MLHLTPQVSDPLLATFRRRIEAFVQAPSFPCIGARSAINSGRADFGLYRGLGQGGGIAALCGDLAGFARRNVQPGDMPTTFLALFDDTVADEQEFEARLWQHLQDLHAHDRDFHPWDPAVSNDPDSEDFSYSVGGRAFFVVGLHPTASRLARRAPMPCMAFNLHDQFLELRSSGKYAKLARVIREREVALQGDLNPMLTEFGQASEARQYSGRVSPAGWRCPFHGGGHRAG